MHAIHGLLPIDCVSSLSQQSQNGIHTHSARGSLFGPHLLRVHTSFHPTGTLASLFASRGTEGCVSRAHIACVRGSTLVRAVVIDGLSFTPPVSLHLIILLALSLMFQDLREAISAETFFFPCRSVCCVLRVRTVCMYSCLYRIFRWHARIMQRGDRPIALCVPHHPEQQQQSPRLGASFPG